MIKLSELVRTIVNEFIEYPNLLTIEENQLEVEEQETTVIKVHSTSKGDLGKLIGKQGKNIDSLRRIINIIASKREIRVDLRIIS